MSEQRHILAEDLALYAMQALSAEEMASMDAALRDDAAARQELAAIQGDLALLGLSAEQQAAPAGSLERLMNRARAGAAESNPAVIPGPVEKAPAEVLAMPRRSKFSVALPWAIAAALALSTILLGTKVSALNDALQDEAGLVANLAAKASHAQQVLEVLTAPTAQRVTLTPAKAPATPTAHTIYLAERGALVMEANNLKPVPVGKAYELWVIPVNGKPIAAGTFTPNAEGYASVVLPKLPGGVPAKAFGVTIEDAAGSPVPTSPLVLAGE